MATRTLTKNIIFRYRNNFAITPSRSAWKVQIHIPRIKLVRTVWIFREKIEKSSSGSRVLYMTLRARSIDPIPE